MIKDNWIAFRITLLLYLLILIVPGAGYIGYTSYQKVKEANNILTVISKVPETLLILQNPNQLRALQGILENNQQKLKIVKAWVQEHKDDQDYVGGTSLPAQYAMFEQCLNRLQSNHIPNDSDTLHCIEQTHSLIFTIDRMVMLKEQRFENIMFVTIAGVVLLLFLGVYLVRLYINIQIKRKAIRDFETTLYNRKFIKESFKKVCAESKRYGNNLTILDIHIKEFDSKTSTLTKKEREQLLHQFGTTMWGLVRESDIAARIEEDRFVLLLPWTSAQQATVLEERITEKTEKRLTLTMQINEIAESDKCESVFENYFAE